MIKEVDKQKLILPYRPEIMDFTTVDATDVAMLNIKSQRVKLSARQLEVIHEFLKGLTVKAIAQKLKLSPRTVESYLNILKNKFSCANKTELIIKLSELK